ncbi:hypothetical protein [Frigidibacter sp. SD6-1]|uniref:hypothetical protein n=1 Tax=Frigidibacter sp. SD6-1 TaxID=3032581 RepID=UPI0024DFD25F|nr:hypothetical protein [Frigidibacter sp. SD6-1]
MSGEVAPRRARARAALLARLPVGSVGADIGVWQSDFSARILETVRPSRLLLVDPWLFRPDRWMPTFGTGLLVNSRAEVPAAGGLVTGDDLGFSDLAKDGRKSVKVAVTDFLAARPRARSAFFRGGGQWGLVRTDEP